MSKKWLIGTIIMILVFVTACSGNGGNTPSGNSGGSTPPASSGGGQSGGNAVVEEEIDPYGPMAETLTINIAQMLPQGDYPLPEGETIDDNSMTRFYEDVLNIKLNRVWTAVQGDAYNQKAMLSIASRDLPDAMRVNEEQLRLMVQAGLLEDLTEVFDKYASPKMKELHLVQAEGKTLETATFDGKLYGIPDTSLHGNAISLTFVRKDWLDQLQLPEPKTLDDIVNIARAFVENDMSGTGNTVGMTGPNTPELSSNKGGRLHGFDGVFASFKSFPRNWVRDDNGAVTYGSIQPQTKDALAKLREIYAAGLIDKEFFLRENADELLLSGQTGIMFGPWVLGWGNIASSFETNPDAVWKAYAAPLADDGKFYSHLQPISNDYLVVRKGFEHPEALMKGVNLKNAIDRQASDVPRDLFDRYQAEVKAKNINVTLDIFRVNSDDVNAVTNRRNLLLDALDGKITRDDLPDEIKTHFDIFSTYMDDTTVIKNYPKVVSEGGYTITQMNGSQAYIVGGNALSQGYEGVPSLLYVPTETMKTRWANLTKLEDETFLKIVIGQAPLDSFDAFVDEWRKLGGDTIIKEVEEMIAQ